MPPSGCSEIVGTKLASLEISRMEKHEEFRAFQIYQVGIHCHCCGVCLKLQCSSSWICLYWLPISDTEI